MEVDVREAKTHLFRLLQRVEAGEEITIVEAGEEITIVGGGTPIARLIPMATHRKQVQGADRGRAWIAEGLRCS
jgi:antitoxin (DNA-binding transcriptional repressor) of toxin-antitoxin stability system